MPDGTPPDVPASPSHDDSTDGSSVHGPRPFRLRAVLFDFDGTLTRPGALDFAAIKREVGCPPDRFVLEWIEALPAGAQREAALAALERFELAGAASSQPNEGAEELVRRLRGQGLAVGVLTRNGRPAVDLALRRFATLGAADFNVIITRDDEPIPKPAPDGVQHAARAMGVAADEMLVVGDYVLDMLAGRAAGAITVLLANGEPVAVTGGHEAAQGPSGGVPCDFVIAGLAELDRIVRLGLPLPAGKLPNDYLAEYLAGVDAGDPALLVPAAVGEDVAAFDLEGAEVLVAHGDPITLGGSRLARSAVLVNANDIAASGAEPRWLLATVLLPTGATPSQALHLLTELSDAATASSISVAGGHTEVTTAVTRPLISLTTLGTIGRAGLRDKRGLQPGDRIVLTKELAQEGTALLAEELGERLRALGMTEDELAACKALLPLASIVPEARIAARFAGVHAMHDITEGGLVTALRELSAAGGRGLTVRLDDIPVAPLTTRVCALLGADPLGLIASGSLLICCRPDETDALMTALHDAGIGAIEIGEVGEASAGVTALTRGRPAPLPELAVDEAARLLSPAP